MAVVRKHPAIRNKKLKFPHKLPKEIIGVIVIALLLGGIYFSNNPISLKQSNTSTASTQAVELGDFPVYSGATFLIRSTSAPCQPDEDMLQTACGSTFYNWETSDSLQQIKDFYTGENIAGSGWQCTVEGTGINEKDGTTSFGKPCLKGAKIWGIGASITKTADNPNPKTVIHLTAN